MCGRLLPGWKTILVLRLDGRAMLMSIRKGSVINFEMGTAAVLVVRTLCVRLKAVRDDAQVGTGIKLGRNTSCWKGKRGLTGGKNR